MTTNNTLPEGFVYIKDIDPTIQVQLRYASTQNFIGYVVDGYLGHDAITTFAAAQALKLAQERFLALGYSIVIYDAYRPQKSVDHFISWANDINNIKMKEIYYPDVHNKLTLFNGFIAKKSSHTRGSAIDLSIISLEKNLRPIEDIIISKRTLTNGQEITYLDDNTVDMGASFDLFDACSSHECKDLEPFQLENRLFLKNIMEECGFKPYSKEWWHYAITNEPFPDTYFDFDIV